MNFPQAHQLNTGEGGFFPKFFPPSHSPPSGISFATVCVPPIHQLPLLILCIPAIHRIPLLALCILPSIYTVLAPLVLQVLPVHSKKKKEKKNQQPVQRMTSEAASPWKVENQSRRRYSVHVHYSLTVTLHWFVLVFFSYRVQRGGHYFLPLHQWLWATPEYNTWPVSFWSRVIEHTPVVHWCCNQ